MTGNNLLRVHNPDVLTCIANLSNDKVFAPPSLAIAMLDQVARAREERFGEDIWSNPDVKFLDPFTKSGVFLREITSHLVMGLETKIPDIQERINHMMNLPGPKTYFQAAFQIQSPWSIRNHDADDPSREDILKPVAFVFAFAPTRDLRQIVEYGQKLNPSESSPENSIAELVKFLPVLVYDGANMTQVDAESNLDIAMASTSATLLARKRESAALVNVNNATLRRAMNSEADIEAIMQIEGFRALGTDVIGIIVNKSDKVSETKKSKDTSLSAREKKKLSAEEKEYKEKGKNLGKLIKLQRVFLLSCI